MFVYHITMDVKFGKVKPNNNIFLNSSAAPSDENFFISNSSSKQDNSKQTQSFSVRINDYDSNILENNAYQLLSDEMFKIEHKISNLENTLSKICNEQEALQTLGAYMQVEELEERKQKIKIELAELNKKYSELGLSAKISSQIANVVNLSSNKKMNIFSRTKIFISKKILAKISKKFDHNQTMKEALENLSNINSGVDELFKLQIPYGETNKRYEKLTAYLNKANTIHSQISKNIDAIAKKKA